MQEKTFSIEFPVLVESVESTLIAQACTSNSNYFTEGISRSTCCCECE